MSIDIRKTVQGSAPRIPFEKLARDVLGKNYQLSLVVCGDKLAQRINKEYRPGRAGKKSYYPNVLSFEIDTNEGEIFLNLRKAEREAKQYDVSLAQRAALLFVHGLFHLKGMDHGDKMEQAEERILRNHGLH